MFILKLNVCIEMLLNNYLFQAKFLLDNYLFSLFYEIKLKINLKNLFLYKL